MQAGCAHEAAFAVASPGQRAPLDSGAYVRVTFNPGVDLAPAWLSDGGGFLYSAQQIDRRDDDRCLAVQPSGGGAITRILCHETATSADSLDVWENAAVGTTGKLAFVWSTTPIGLGSRTPSWEALVVGSLDHPEPVQVLKTIPYLSPSGAGHEGVSHITWLDPTTLVYLGEHLAQFSDDVIRTGIEVVRMDIGAPATFTVVAGTDSASSVVAVGSDTIYYTRNGDTHVYRRVLSTGAVNIVMDFGGEIARDVQVAGSRLVAVVGGKAHYFIDPAAGPTQLDRGGYLHLVDLSSGHDSVLPPPPGGLRWYRHPALSPDGSRIVAEGHHVDLIDHYVEGVFVGTDTIIDPADDLWRLNLP